MRIVHFEKGGVLGIAADDGSGWHGLMERESGFPGTLPELIAQGADLLRTGRHLLPMHRIDLNAVRILPPVPRPPKLLCVGLNYEAELAVGIGRGGRRIQRERALDHVAGYSLFNDASIRDFQLRTPQWTM